jgi:hypothetical protein
MVSNQSAFAAIKNLKLIACVGGKEVRHMAQALGQG